MSSKSSLYRKLIRLRTKRSRLERRISVLERKLAGGKYNWGNCSRQAKR